MPYHLVEMVRTDIKTSMRLRHRAAFVAFRPAQRLGDKLALALLLQFHVHTVEEMRQGGVRQHTFIKHFHYRRYGLFPADPIENGFRGFVFFGRLSAHRSVPPQVLDRKAFLYRFLTAN